MHDTQADRPTSAMVFAAGFGTRMGTLTRNRPKPMVPLCGRPMIDHTIEYLQEAGIRQIVANTHYLHDVIAPHLRSRGVEISHEQGEILDTGGGLRRAKSFFPAGPIVTMNPDTAWRGRNPVAALLDAWSPEMTALLLLIPVDRAIGRTEPGDFDLTDGRVSRRGPFVYTGLQIINPALTEDVDARVFSLNRVWDNLIAVDQLNAVVYDGTWCDIGHPAGLEAAESMMRASRV